METDASPSPLPDVARRSVSVQCAICTRIPLKPSFKNCKYRTLEELEYHVALRHSHCAIYECQSCRYTSNSASHAAGHLTSHHAKDNCKLHLIVPSRQALALHERILLRSFYGRNRCQGPMVGAKRGSSWAKIGQKPILEARRARREENRCRLCKTVVWMSNEGHVYKKHIGCFPYECLECNFKSIRRSEANRHHHPYHMVDQHRALNQLLACYIALCFKPDDIAVTNGQAAYAIEAAGGGVNANGAPMAMEDGRFGMEAMSATGMTRELAARKLVEVMCDRVTEALHASWQCMATGNVDRKLAKGTPQLNGIGDRYIKPLHAQELVTDLGASSTGHQTASESAVDKAVEEVLGELQQIEVSRASSQNGQGTAGSVEVQSGTGNSISPIGYCQLCEKEVSNKVHLSKELHVCRAHLRSFPYSCTLCVGVAYLTKAELANHCYSQHNQMFWMAKDNSKKINPDFISEFVLQCFPSGPVERSARSESTEVQRAELQRAYQFIVEDTSLLATVKAVCSTWIDKNGDDGGPSPQCPNRILRTACSHSLIWHILTLYLCAHEVQPAGFSQDEILHLTAKHFVISPTMDDDEDVSLSTTLQDTIDQCLALDLVTLGSSGCVRLAESAIWLADAVRSGRSERLIKALLLEDIRSRRRGNPIPCRSLAEALSTRACQKCGHPSSAWLNVFCHFSESSACGYGLRWRCRARDCLHTWNYPSMRDYYADQVLASSDLPPHLQYRPPSPLVPPFRQSNLRMLVERREGEVEEAWEVPIAETVWRAALSPTRSQAMPDEPPVDATVVRID